MRSFRLRHILGAWCGSILLHFVVIMLLRHQEPVSRFSAEVSLGETEYHWHRLDPEISSEVSVDIAREPQQPWEAQPTMSDQSVTPGKNTTEVSADAKIVKADPLTQELPREIVQRPDASSSRKTIQNVPHHIEIQKRPWHRFQDPIQKMTVALLQRVDRVHDVDLSELKKSWQQIQAHKMNSDSSTVDASAKKLTDDAEALNNLRARGYVLHEPLAAHHTVLYVIDHSLSLGLREQGLKKALGSVIRTLESSSKESRVNVILYNNKVQLLAKKNQKIDSSTRLNFMRSLLELECSGTSDHLGAWQQAISSSPTVIFWISDIHPSRWLSQVPQRLELYWVKVNTEDCDRPSRIE